MNEHQNDRPRRKYEPHSHGGSLKVWVSTRSARWGEVKAFVKWLSHGKHSTQADGSQVRGLLQTWADWWTLAFDVDALVLSHSGAPCATGIGTRGKGPSGEPTIPGPRDGGQPCQCNVPNCSYPRKSLGFNASSFPLGAEHPPGPTFVSSVVSSTG